MTTTHHTNDMHAVQHDLDGVAETLRRSTVVIHADGPPPTRGGRRAPSGQGSGLLWGADGTVVTNAHVAVGDSARIVLADGRSARAEVIARDRRIDLAVLRAEPLAAGAPLIVPTLGEPSALRVGELVVALGH